LRLFCLAVIQSDSLVVQIDTEPGNKQKNKKQIAFTGYFVLCFNFEE